MLKGVLTRFLKLLIVRQYDGLYVAILPPAWRWRDDKPPETISCPEEYSLSYLTPDQLALLHQEIDTWIKDGWLLEVPPEQECNIRCCLPIVPAINELKSTPVRPTLNFAFLNSHCVQASDPFAADCGKELRRWRCCPQAQVLDVRRAYPSLKIRDDLSWYQCLRYKGTYFRLVRLGFGASCAPRLLKNVLDFVLQNYPTTLRYFDDILVARSPTQSLDDFKKSVAEVRNVLSQNGLKTKDPVDLNGAHLLGLEIYQDDTGTLLWRRRLPLESLLESIEARFDKPPLLTAREVGSWLGKLVAHVPCAGYLRVCVAVGRRLLNHSCGRDRSAWSRPVADDVRDYVKKLCSVIRQSGDPAFGRWLLPESSEKIRCWVDASQLAEAVLLTDSANLILADGAWLAPTGDVGSAGKPSTHINVRELDVIIRGIKYIILYGFDKATIMSDSRSAVSWLSKTLNHQKVVTKGMYSFLIDRRLSVIRSLVREFNLDIDVQWICSEKNLSDSLTRLPKELSAQSPLGAAVFVNSWGGEGVQNHWWPDNSDLLEAQASEDIDCEVSSKFDLRDGLVYYDGLPYLPASLRRRVILSLHQSLLHPGRSSTASTLKEYFRFPNLDVEVENALESCTDEICQRGRRKPVSLSTETCRRLATEPWSCVGVDITYVHSVPVLSCICDYSRYAAVRVLRGESSDHLYFALQSIFCSPGLGFPIFVRCDRGSNFLALRSILRSRGTTLVPSSGHRGSANGVCERFHGILKRRLLFAPSNCSLQARLDLVCDAYNRTVHGSTQQSPLNRLFGRKLRLGAELPCRVPQAEGVSPFQEGQEVWILKPREQRRAGARFLTGVYKITNTTPFASRFRSVDHSGRSELVVTNDRIISKSDESEAQQEESPVTDDNESFFLSSEEAYSVASHGSAEAEEDQLHDEVLDVPGNDVGPGLLSTGAPEEHSPPDANVLGRRNRHPPVRFIPGGNPREVSFDEEGYPIEPQP